MNRKRMSFCLLVFLLFSTVASAQQATKADIKVLETKIASLENTVKEMDKRLTNQIGELDKRLTNQIIELDKRINILFWAIGVLVAVILAVIALPQLLGYFQEKRARADFQKQIEELTQV